MRRLMLLRHAKSARPAGTSDLDRPLNDRGQAEARRLGAFLAAEKVRFDLALVSPARRTRETWNLLEPALGKVDIRLEPRLYEGKADALLALIREVGPAVQTLLVVGHNPGCEDLAHLLIGDDDGDALDRLARGFPPATLAVIDAAVEEWSALGPRGGRLVRFVTPTSVAAVVDE